MENKKEYLDNIIRKFCSKDQTRPALMRPHLDEEIVISTNAHVLIMCPLIHLSGQYYASDNFPNYKAIIPIESEYNYDNIINSTSWDFIKKDIPIVDVFEECEYCKCTGEVKCNLGYNHECENCTDGHTRVIIGKEYDYEKYLIKIGDCIFNPNYVDLLFDVATFFNTNIIVKKLVAHKICLFIINDVKVLLMPSQNRETKIFEIPIQ